MNPGDEKEITASFPDDYFNKKLAGHTVDFKVKLNEIRKEVLPEIDDEMAKQLGRLPPSTKSGIKSGRI
jgi:trigger factor